LKPSPSLFVPHSHYSLQTNNSNTQADTWKNIHGIGSEPLTVNNVTKTGIIEISEGEGRLFSFLLTVLRETKTQTTLRVAGGWVRDKVCPFHSSDLSWFLAWAVAVEVGVGGH